MAKVSAKTFEKIKGLRALKDYSYGWTEQRCCGRCNDKTMHSVYLTAHILNHKYKIYNPTKIGFYVCENCGNYQGV